MLLLRVRSIFSYCLRVRSIFSYCGRYRLLGPTPLRCPSFALPVLVLCHSWPPQHLKTVALAFAVASAFPARTTRYCVKLSHYYCNYFNIYGSRRLRPFALLVLLSICGCFSLPLLRTISNSPSRVLSFTFVTVAFMPYLVRLLLLLALAFMPYLARLLLLQHFAEFSRDALHLELLLGRLATTTTSCHKFGDIVSEYLFCQCFFMVSCKFLVISDVTHI